MNVRSNYIIYILYGLFLLINICSCCFCEGHGVICTALLCVVVICIMFTRINFFSQYNILKQAGIKIPIFIDNFHFQTVNIDGMYSNWGYG